MAAAGAAPGMHHGGMGGDETGALGMDDGALHLPGPRSYEKTLDAARNMISDDPKRVAQVVRKWISEDGRH
jgi:flagellar M-ring protein FliF